jgi:MOSC domain
MPDIRPSILSIQVGKAAPLEASGVMSGFVKRIVRGPVVIAPLGLTSDEQADLSVHGGPDKAVYFYPSEHYATWAREFPEHHGLFAPGGFGENLTTAGLIENTVAAISFLLATHSCRSPSLVSLASSWRSASTTGASAARCSDPVARDGMPASLPLVPPPAAIR